MVQWQSEDARLCFGGGGGGLGLCEVKGAFFWFISFRVLRGLGFMGFRRILGVYISVVNGPVG